MTRRLLIALAVAFSASPLDAQLPYLTAPTGTLRLEFGGAFGPTSSEFADGTRRSLGDPIAAATLTATSSPVVRDMEARLGVALGRAPTPGGSLGGLGADAMLQRGTGIIGLGLGISNRLTAVARIPIVSARTEVRLDPDTEAATLGLNPALLGDQTSALFLDQFDAALGELQNRITAGDYAGSPDLESLATQTITEGSAFRDALDVLLVGSAASPVLPTTVSADGTDLLARVGTLRDRLTNALGIPGFTASPALPSEPLTSSGFDQLLAAPGGFDLAAFDQQPLVSLGDVELGLVAMLAQSRSEEGRNWFGLWATGGVTLPTGTPPDPAYLRDAGTGDGQLDVRIGGIVEVGRGRLGARAALEYRVQLEGTREARLGGRDDFLLPSYRLATLDWDPGDVMVVSVTPFVRLADRLAITGTATWLSRGEDTWSLPDGVTVPGTGSVASMGAGSAASQLRLGMGLSYAHAGPTIRGGATMPVEAGLGIERTTSSGSGLVEAPLTTMLWFRVYKKIW